MIHGEQYEDKLLVDAARSGDAEAFDVLVRRHQDAIYNLTYRLCGNGDDALELTQEAFMKAWRAIERFDGSSSFFTWLYRIGINTALSERRRARRSDVSYESLAGPGELRPRRADGTEPDVSTRVETSERRELVQRAIARLEPDYRAAIVLRDIQQMGYDEIARTLNVPVGTVKSRIYRARLELKEKLKGVL